MTTAVRALVVAGLLLGGLVGGGLLIVACSEMPSGREGSGVCEATTGSALGWLAFSFWPVAAFGATQLVPGLRRHGLAVGAAIAAVATVVWVGANLQAAAG
jgi:hypothetical protein